MKKLLLLGWVAISPISFAAEPPVSLAGEWKFSWRGGEELSESIRLPGTMSDAGLGPKNTAEVDYSGPYHRHAYEGPAWYEREVEIPEAWEGQRVTLFLERCYWMTKVWFDGKLIGSQDSLSAPHVYVLGFGIKPGKHRLTICVDNKPPHELGQFVSALRGGTWGNRNGIIGRIELQATPAVWVDTVQVYPDVAARKVAVKVRIGNATGKGGKGNLEVGPVRREVRWNEEGGLVHVEVPMPQAALWDEFSPRLQTLNVRLGEHEQVVRFGLREVATEGTRLTVNGKPVFLRGTLECSVWPLTGYPPTDVASWRKIYQIIRAHGLNHMRFHSWCPPKAAFEAADEEGILLQVEGPCANVQAGLVPARDAYLGEEYRRIVDTYGNHPSFCLMSPGNEFGGDRQVIEGWLGMLRARDPRHLYTSASNNELLATNRQFSVHVQGRGIHGQGTMHDVSEVVAGDPVPIIGHEIGQWTYWPDPAEIRKWTGVMELRNFAKVHENLKNKGLADLERSYVEACGRFATLLYKEEIELLLRTPGYAGYQLLDLHDYPSQGTALIGPLDAFWDSKGFITAEGFRRFSGETVPLLRIPKRTYSAGERFSAKVDIAHYGAKALQAVVPKWVITDFRGDVLASGELPSCDVAAGGLNRLGSFEVPLQGVKQAGKYVVSVSVGGFANDWEIWIYPEEREAAVAPDVVICERWEEAKSALAEGRKVLFHAHGCDGDGAMKGKFQPVFWSPVWFPDQKPMTMSLLCDPAHPMLKGFPTEMHSNWQWYGLMRHSRLFVLDDTPIEYRPTVQVIDNFVRNRRIGTVFEALVGKGSLLVNGYDLGALKDDPAARRLSNRIMEYVGSKDFQPKQQLDPSLLDRLFASRGQAK